MRKEIRDAQGKVWLAVAQGMEVEGELNISLKLCLNAHIRLKS